MCEKLALQFSTSGGKNEYNYGNQYASSSLLWNVLAQIDLNNYDIAEKLLTAKLNESIRTGNSFDLGTIYNHLAEVQQAKGDIEKALVYLNKALKEENKAGHDISCKGILNSIGYMLFKQKGNHDEQVLYYYRKALAIVNRDNSQNALNSLETLNILASIGELYTRKGFYDSAFYYYQRAFDEIKPGMDETRLLDSQFNELAKQKKMSYITGLLLNKGDAYLQVFRARGETNALKNAISVYKATDQLIDRIKREQLDLKSRLFWRSDNRRLYEHAIEACYEYGNADEEFYFFEKSRAVLLNDQLNEQRWLGEGDIQKQTQIRKKMLQLEYDLDTADRNSNRFRELQDELFIARQESNHLLQIIKERNPLYYQSIIDFKVATIKDVDNNILSDHQALLEIYSGDSAVYILTIKHNHSDFAKLNKKTYDSLTRTYMSYISNASVNTHYEEFVSVSRSLYQLIFHHEELPKGRIIISPDGEYFPFEALIKNSSDSRPVYFLNDYAVSYTYSAKFLMDQSSTHSDSKSPEFLGVAPVNCPAGMQLAALTGSDLSLVKLQTHFKNSKLMVLSGATKAEFLNRYSKYRIIQMYAHAIDSGKTGEPVIYFADSALNLSELLGEDKPVSNLIVLSACESARGRLYKGEGVFSFNRGFAALGIPSSVSNLWSVEDKATYRLTELFYKYLAMGMPMDVSLQKAKIEFIETGTLESQLPYYWAAAVLIGKTNAIEFGRSFSWGTSIWVLVILFFLSILIYLGIIKNKKENHQ